MGLLKQDDFLINLGVSKRKGFNWKFDRYINNSRHLARKYARIFVRGQISEHIFTPNGDYCLYHPSNLFRNARNFQNWGIYNNIIISMSPSWIWSDKITNERVAWVGYNHLISNKGEWNNCFSKFSNRVLPPIFISTIEGLRAKRAYIEFWPIFIFCRIKLIFGRLTCFDMKSIVP